MPGYSGTPLAKKLGIKTGSSVHAIGAPANYRSLLEPLPEHVRFTARADASTDLVHVFSTRSADLSKTLTALRKTLAPSSTVWVSWPKKASKVATDVTEHTIRTLAFPLGYVDIKVCAVTEVWSGLKLVVRKALR
jgi:hypothetical protein